MASGVRRYRVYGRHNIGRNNRYHGRAWYGNTSRAAIETNAVDTEAASLFRGILRDVDGYAVGSTTLGVFDCGSGFGARGNLLASTSIFIPIDEFKILVLLSGNLNMVDRE